jgi:PAS domain S-box-containing protein
MKNSGRKDGLHPMLTSFEAILDSLNDGVYVCDLERRIVYWNQAAEKITGWRAEEILGRHCLDDFLCHEDKDGHRMCGKEHCPLHRAMITGTVTHVPVIAFARSRDNRRIPMQITAAPIRDAEGKVVGGVETFRDVSPMLGDLRRARKIQSRALDKKRPPDPRIQFKAHYLPHDMVGGDYYAFQPLDAEHYGFMLADMEGHGLAAALNTIQLDTMWERHYHRLKSPAVFGQAISQDLRILFGRDTSFATAVMGTIDARQGQTRITVAGGPPPVLIKADKSITPLNPGGIPLGILDDYTYREQIVRLAPRERLLIFTDGALEIENRRGQPLGTEGFLAVLQAMGYPATPLNFEALCVKLLRYSNAIRFPDDLTVLEIGYQDTPPE